MADGPQQFADQPDARKLLDSRTVYEGRIWDVVSDTFSLSGSGDDVLVRDYIAHPGAVAVLAMDERGRVLLLKQYRQPARMSFWEIPAGLLDVDGEDFAAAAARAGGGGGPDGRALGCTGGFLQFTRLLQRGDPDLPGPGACRRSRGPAACAHR